jgi:hypothetical protein
VVFPRGIRCNGRGRRLDNEAVGPSPVTEDDMRAPLGNVVRPWAVLAAVGLLGLAAPLRAQGTGRPTVSDSRDGYIDDAIPGDQFRLRYDASYDFTRPTRAEFFYPQGGPNGRGLPLPESRVDFQDVTAYLELAAAERLSGFVEVPWRFLNPEVNPDHNGLSDVSAGFKYAVIDDSDLVATFQFRTYAPTGDARRGLGTDHVSLEPALLVWKPLAGGFGLESELRYWAPVGGTDFAGDIIRYGVGLHYDLPLQGRVRLSPVATVVGWTVLGGKESVVHPSGLSTVEDATGQTIVNVKLGARAQLGRCGDVYMGYGRPLTGDRWYANTFRLEWRLAF